MFKFLLGVAFGAAGYWAWQSFGRDLLGMGSDQETLYGGFSSSSGSSSSFGSGSSSASGGLGANNSSSSAIGATSDPSASSGGPGSTGE
jgi:hypothetical protein